jgi:hypothetical protein
MTIPCMNETERKNTGFLHFLRNQKENEMNPYADLISRQL